MSHADETGVIEIENNTYVVNKKDIIEVRRILDKLTIHYILDRVSYHSTEGALVLAKAIHNTSIWKVEKDCGVQIDNQFGHWVQKSAVFVKRKPFRSRVPESEGRIGR